MPDIDDLLNDPDFVHDAASDVRIPPFTPLREAGVRRSRRRRALTAAASALAVVAVVGGVWLGLSGGDNPTAPAGPPSEFPSRTPPTSEPTQATERPVDDGRPLAQEPAWFEGENSYLSAFALMPGENAVAGLWGCVKECDGLRQVIVVKAGRDRSVFAIRPRGTLAAASGRRFVFAAHKPGAEPRMFDVNGEIPLDESTVEAPLREGELLTQVNGSGVPIVALRAVDPATATTHPVPMPDDVLRTVQADGTSLTAEGEQGVWTSDDGGATWTRNDADRADHLTAFVPSALPGTRVLLLGGDGATLFPVQRIVRLFPDGSSAGREVDLASPFYLGGAVREDGRLVMVLRGGELDDRPQVFIGDPEGDLREIEPIGFEDVVDLRAVSTQGGLTLVADTPDRDRVLVSSDGEVWKSVRTR